MRPTTNLPTCPVTGKKSYTSKRDARSARRRHHAGAQLNVYRCTSCGFLHLGHMPQRVRSGDVEKTDWMRTQ